MGDRHLFLEQARLLLSRQVGPVQRQSAVYETAAWGKTDQAAFLNQVLLVQTHLPPLPLLQQIHAIEKELGRERQEKWAARVVDIDMLFYEQEVVREPGLTVPHPELHKRRFTLVPLAELAPGLLHPVLSKTVQELLEECPDALEVRKLPPPAPSAQ
jgi:2-amino-4-hydroxy-6-hydroxymethyldihydropteridine diphosphokinase